MEEMQYLLRRRLLRLLLRLEQLVLLIVIEAHAHPLRPQLRLYRLVDALPVATQALTCNPTRPQIALPLCDDETYRGRMRGSCCAADQE